MRSKRGRVGWAVFFSASLPLSLVYYIQVNCAVYIGHPGVPFGGYKQSGVGGKEFGKHALDTCVLFDALGEWDADVFVFLCLNLKVYTAEGSTNQSGSQNVVYPSCQYLCTMLNGKYQCRRKLGVSHSHVNALPRQS